MVFVLNGGAEHGVDPRWCEVNHDAGDPTHEGSCEVALTEKFESIKDEDTSVMVEKVVSESSAISLGSLSAGMGCSLSLSRRAEVLVLKVPAWPYR
jgi:hypothetical protein